MNLDIVLLEPEIPQNTGNIARTCVAIGARLHLVGHLGFSLEDRYLKRAGLDYWFDLDLTLWDSLDDFLEDWQRRALAANGAEAGVFYATTRAQTRFTDTAFPERTALIFGPETRGLPEPLLQARPDRCIRIPMRDGNRSLNLANSVAVVAYEAMRQNGFPGLR